MKPYTYQILYEAELCIRTLFTNMLLNHTHTYIYIYTIEIIERYL